MHHAWERAIRRARRPLAYTQGFNPQAQLQFAAALPVGFTGQGEVADVFLNEAFEPAEFLSRLTAALPPGIRPLRAEPVAPEIPSLQSQVVARVTGWRSRQANRTPRSQRGWTIFWRAPRRGASGARAKTWRVTTCGRWCRSWPTSGQALTGNRSPL